MLQRRAAARGLDLRLDDAALLVGQVAEFHESVDKKAKSLLRRQAAGGNMRRIDQAELFEIAHHVADSCRRKRGRQHARQVSRTDRLAVPHVRVDDAPENIARAHVERLQGRICYRFGHRREKAFHLKDIEGECANTTD
jgi:hypothetical protein